MNKYAVFAGDFYYPLGGMNDYQDSFVCIRECIEWWDDNKGCEVRKGRDGEFKWCEIWNMKSGGRLIKRYEI